MITTIADCNLLLSLAAKEKSDLDYRKLGVERQLASYAENAVEVEAELQTVTTELEALTTIIATLPEGETKDDNITKKKRLELKQHLLNEKRENYGSVALLSREFDLARLEKELRAVEEFTTAVQQRKDEL